MDKTTPILKPQIPEGWWSLADLSGSPAGIRKAIESNPDIAPHWKAAILAELDIRVVSPFNFAYVDGHFFHEKSKVILHIDITPDTKSL